MATKSTRKDRRRSRRRRQKRYERRVGDVASTALQTMRERQQARYGGRLKVRLTDPKGPLPKLSQVLEEFAWPLIEAAQVPDDIEAAVSRAIIAWNLAIVPEDVQASLVHAAMDGFGDDRDALRFKVTLAALVARKKALFDEDRRFVVDYETTVTSPGNLLHLAVTYHVHP